jgi:hypothetical protein
MCKTVTCTTVTCTTITYAQDSHMYHSHMHHNHICARQSHVPQSHAPQSHMCKTVTCTTVTCITVTCITVTVSQSRRFIVQLQRIYDHARAYTAVTELYATHTFLHTMHTLALAWYMRGTKMTEATPWLCVLMRRGLMKSKKK